MNKQYVKGGYQNGKAYLRLCNGKMVLFTLALLFNNREGHNACTVQKTETKEDDIGFLKCYATVYEPCKGHAHSLRETTIYCLSTAIISKKECLNLVHLGDQKIILYRVCQFCIY